MRPSNDGRVASHARQELPCGSDSTHAEVIPRNCTPLISPRYRLASFAFGNASHLARFVLRAKKSLI